MSWDRNAAVKIALGFFVAYPLLWLLIRYLPIESVQKTIPANWPEIAIFGALWGACVFGFLGGLLMGARRKYREDDE